MYCESIEKEDEHVRRMFPGSSQAAALQLPRGHCNTKTSCEYMRMTFLDRSSSSLSYYNCVDVNFPCSNSFLLPEFPSGSLCRSRRELSNEKLLAKFGFNIAENEPCKVRKFELSGI